MSFLAICYATSSFGYVVLSSSGEVEEIPILCMQWVGLLLYCCLFAPALHYHFLVAQSSMRTWSELDGRLVT